MYENCFEEKRTMTSTNINRLSVFALFIFLMATSSTLMAINPVSSNTKCMLVSESEEWDYYKFDNKNPLEFNVKGGRRYKFIIRSERVPESNIELNSYLDGKLLKTYHFSKNLSRKTRLKSNNQTVTMGYVIYFKVPKGEHKLKITAESELFGRMYTETSARISIAPLSYADDDYLIVGDEEYEYFFTSKTEPAIFELYGPLDITLYSRLSYFPENRGLQHYTVYFEDNGNKKTMNFETQPSSTGVYKTHRNIIPGKAEKQKIKLDDGKHEIKIWGENVAIKLYVPQSQLTGKK